MEVSTGIQCFDENGKVILDITNRLCKIIGQFETGNNDGAVFVGPLIGGSFFAFPVSANYPIPNGFTFDKMIPPIVSYKNNYITWKFKFGYSGFNRSHLFYYGVY